MEPLLLPVGTLPAVCFKQEAVLRVSLHYLGFFFGTEPKANVLSAHALHVVWGAVYTVLSAVIGTKVSAAVGASFLGF